MLVSLFIPDILEQNDLRLFASLLSGSSCDGFLVTAVDAGNSGDLIKITIWDKLDGDRIIYDNITMNELGGGYITIISQEFATEDNETTSPNETTVSTEFALEQNFPNPFNPATTISFSIPFSEFTTLKIFDILGNEMVTLVNEEKQAGSYLVEFNAVAGELAATLSAGVLEVRLPRSGSRRRRIAVAGGKP